jgi:diacylglycerol kinase family enzyme
MNTAPKSKLTDGMCDILTIQGDKFGRLTTTKQLLDQETGDYYDRNGNIKPGLEYKKTNFFRFHPRSNRDASNPQRNFNAFYSIDGERYPIEPINVKVIPSSLKVFCLNK